MYFSEAWKMLSSSALCYSHFLYLLFMEGRKRIAAQLGAGNIKRVYRLFLKTKQRTPGFCVCVCARAPVWACVWSFIYFSKEGKKHLIFDLFIGVSLCLHPNTFISYSVDVKISLCVFLSDFILWSYVFVLCSFIKWCFSFPKKVIIAFEHDLFFHQNSCCLSQVTEQWYLPSSWCLKLVFDDKVSQSVHQANFNFNWSQK